LGINAANQEAELFRLDAHASTFFVKIFYACRDIVTRRVAEAGHEGTPTAPIIDTVRHSKNIRAARWPP
jgi:hypothetical protein